MVDPTFSVAKNNVARRSITTKELLETTGMRTLNCELKRWKFIGHVLRQDRENHSSIVLTWTPRSSRTKTKNNV